MAKLVDEFERSLEDKFAESKLQESCVKCNCIVSENIQVLPRYPKVERSCETFCKPKWVNQRSSNLRTHLAKGSTK